jgi:V/A-type H+/Na+-transporting ATPase subunit D
MAKIAFNKSSLQKIREQMKLYKGLLPSLDLKRRQLTAELAKAKVKYEKSSEAVKALMEDVGKKLPMLANAEIDLSGLVKVKEVKAREDNIVGVRIPVVDEVICEVQPYSMLVRRHWVDDLVEKLKQMAMVKAQEEAAKVQVQRLEVGLRRITQKVNLFEKILIPESKQIIAKIQIFLGDTERSAVVRSKISKQKNRTATIEEDV